MNRKYFVFCSLLVIISMLLGACQATTPEVKTVIQTVVVEGKAQTIEKVITATPVPPKAPTAAPKISPMKPVTRPAAARPSRRRRPRPARARIPPRR